MDNYNKNKHDKKYKRMINNNKILYVLYRVGHGVFLLDIGKKTYNQPLEYIFHIYKYYIVDLRHSLVVSDLFNCVTSYIIS